MPLNERGTPRSYRSPRRASAVRIESSRTEPLPAGPSPDRRAQLQLGAHCPTRVLGLHVVGYRPQTCPAHDGKQAWTQRMLRLVDQGFPDDATDSPEQIRHLTTPILPPIHQTDIKP